MSIFELEAESRSDMGKGASRRLRRDGKVPAVIYGGGEDPQSITLVHSEILKRIMHMDFQRVDESKPIRVHVPLHFIGEDVAPGAKAGGLITHELIEVALDVLPRHLPEFIEVDVSALEVGESRHLSDLPLPESGSLVELARGEGHDLPVVSIHVRRGGGETEEGEAVEGGEAAAEGES
jgi:large subunit ribosomal protein L25